VNVLETDRLLFRHLTMDDVDALAPLYADPEIRKYFPDGVQTYEQTKEEVDWIINVYYAKHGYGLWATILKETGEFIGRCGLIPWMEPNSDQIEPEVAYLISKPHWGKGLGTEAAKGIVRYGFEQLHLPRIVCFMYPGNQPSVRTALSAGLTFYQQRTEFEGQYIGEPYLVYEIKNPMNSQQAP
jgi:[ribosomal protein S5]-alanine N-acetyltransferase